MSEKDVLEKIEKSAAQEQIPERLSPEQIKKKLKRKQKKNRAYYGAVGAAILVLLLGVSARTLIVQQAYPLSVNNDEETVSRRQAELTADEEVTLFYTAAKDYGEVYDAVANQIAYAKAEQAITREEALEDESSDVTYILEDGAESSAAQMIKGASNVPQQFSKTNIQTDGVDESDFVKTDGSYIYTVSGTQIFITDIRKKSCEQIAKISFSEDASIDVLEMYVDNSNLSIIVQKDGTKIEQQSQKTDDRIYYLNESVETEVITYDISNPKKTVKKGSVSQDGTYQTSRKMGDVIYLFTNQSIRLPNETREEAVIEENISGWIPTVNGTAVEAEDIYIEKGGSSSVLISAVDVEKPDSIVDNMMILSQHVDIYVSSSAFYLYRTTGAWNHSATQIAKFSLNDGRMDAIGAATANGTVMDTFAVNEADGKLRVLTTGNNALTGVLENNLYLFDENLKVTGKLEGMAEGEEIYAARYLGDMAYFVTYRNTDPLFAVDLSDAQNPKILGELEISGFSEYLHFWGEHQLVGIGYETEETSGEHLGIKITMFDIENPSELKEMNSFVLKEFNYSEALYQYKCVLADAQENLLGFALQSYDEKDDITYVLLSWNGKKFETLLSQNLAEEQQNEVSSANLDTAAYRGLYVDDMFYIVSPDGMISYDRNNHYALQKRMKFS